ncbi:hypothetical protein PAXRUDRAFT_828386 [Paxillus rubicundulus Ve08.2h10]|uniref:Uncharacterized protein n=1 Tax=Paxillus rubicundulus Ve08.2h10 TaxID=930991 RepID=A0A0D0DW89_9AGAM|nr:hypothetical protein PAXRUDRAFT_828386 [Paxillus rubicundulus Ve08.2h10]
MERRSLLDTTQLAMGRSAKFHKRIKKTGTSSNTQSRPATQETKKKPSPNAAPSVQSAKKRADLKSKVKARPTTKSVDGEHVLGGADYVTLLLGGRRKAAEEALKLPKEQ